MTSFPIPAFFLVIIFAFFGAFLGGSVGLTVHALGTRSRLINFLSGGVSGALAALVAPIAGYVLLEITMGTLGGYITDPLPENRETPTVYSNASRISADRSNKLRYGADRSSIIDNKHPELTDDDLEAGWEYGVVKWYNKSRGYGFIAPQNKGKDVFIHASALEASGVFFLEEGMQIAFVLKQDPDRRSALRIRTTSSAEVSNLTRHERLGEKRLQPGGQGRASMKARFERNKPHVKLGVLGQTGHGKTMLTAAITKYFGEFMSFERIDAAPEEKARGITIATNFVEYSTDDRHYSQIDSPTHKDLVKNLITGAAQVDGAILVVDSIEGPMRETKAQVELASHIGVPGLVVYLNNIDQMDEEARLGLVEMEVRELLSDYDFPGDDIPIIKGSALAAMEGKDAEIGENSVRELMAAVDEYIPTPERPIDQPFLMPIEDVFSISGRGTVVTGRVERGVIKVGEEVEIVGLKPTRKTVVTGVEMFRKRLDRGEAGDNIGALLRGIARDDVERGQVLCKPGSITPHTRFEAAAYILTEEEGGRHTPFFTNYRPQFYFRTTDVTGTVELPDGVEMVMPGDNVTFTVQLNAPIAMEEKLRFAIREGGRTVGAGVVTRIIE